MMRKMINNKEIKGVTYGFHINNSDSNPNTCVTYLKNCDNYGFKPAGIDFSSDTFDWGDWSEDEFFIPRPCVLKFNGTVDYYLDPSDYNKKIDGTPSDIASDNCNGNAMMEWGRDDKRIYYKFVTSGTDAGYECSSTSPNVYITNNPGDDSDYHCWNFYDAGNTLRDHFYTPIYNGYKDSGNRLRSLSGKTPTVCTTVINEVSYAIANNTAGGLSGDRWYTETYGDRILINLLLILIGKSLDMQDTYGYGNCDNADVIDIKSGTMDTKGLFWGSDDKSSGVKVFGMENYWGNLYRRIAGCIYYNGYYYHKLTPNNIDGSTAIAYTTSYSGMRNTGIRLNSSGYISSLTFNTLGFYTPSGITNANEPSAFYCDYHYYCNTPGTNYYALVGGCCWGNDLEAGAFYLDVYYSASSWSSCVSAAVSFR